MIVSARGEPRRIVQEANGGLCVEPENPKALSKAILTLHRDPEMCRRLGLNGQRAVDSQYSLRAMARKLESVLYQVTHQ